MRFSLPLRPVTDPAEQEIFQNRLRAVLTRLNDEDRYALVKKEGWIAVPDESGGHLSVEDQTRLLEVITERGETELCAFPLHPHITPSLPIYKVPVTVEGIAEFNWVSHGFNYALFAGAPDWIIICTIDDFIVVVGDELFVRRFLGREPDEAFANFYSFATDALWPDQQNNSLIAVHEALQHSFSQAPSGTWVQLEL